MLYVKNKMAEATLLSQRKGKKFFLGYSRVFLLDFLFQDLHMFIEYNKLKNWSLKFSQKGSELFIIYLFRLNSFFFFLLGM